ncbi:VC0807 family protein [Actinocatenispora thailandica]|uniref:VC0807 family protein n=1 Tax=Actinocatenispora thailandica TaxID=227318 RepID=UPI0019528710|nr:VC0807 family protein [Actinocatenispora thailandica]
MTTHDPAPSRTAAGSGLRPVIVGLLTDLGVPIAVYYLLRALGVEPYQAMLGGTVAAGLRLAWVAVRSRRFDGIAALLAAMFAFGLVLSLVSGDPRFLLAKDSAMTGLAGLVFLGSAVAGRPAIYALHRRMVARTPQARAATERLWATTPPFRRIMTAMTVVWGVGLLAESAIRVALVYLLDLDVAVAASGLLQVVALVTLLGYTMIARRRAVRRADRIDHPAPATVAAPVLLR